MRSASFVLLSFLAASAAAQSGTFEQILVPFDTMTQETASGHWRAELWVRNSGTMPVNIWAAECVQFDQPVACSRRLDVPAGRTMLADGFEPDGSSPGVLLYVNRERSGDVIFNLRVRDLSRGTDDIGTEIPVVRESDLRHGSAEMINVPLLLYGRTHLRLYTPDANAAFTVRVYAEPDGALLAERQFAASLPGGGIEPPELPMVIDASSVFRGWVADRVRVTVERVQPGGAPFWPLLTITNARNNHITTITPQ
jgi:hypothetical protein